ncbi:sensor histidine kinase [Paenibacillus thermotolerans]|uniref:sensor histidine kinase n=1 Tax=Paenibacillus thermotolerans TaxID=3027807 RepID=UPI0023676ECA|nr:MULTISPECIES: HAMP domain-containing sensor histidine kinase [unclassified Paenibacillus]
MSIRNRLLLSYLTMLIVPLVLLGICMLVIASYVFGELPSAFTLDMQQKNPIAAVINEEADIAADIRMHMNEDPDSLLNPDLMQQYSNRLRQLNMGMIAGVNGKVVYASPGFQGTELATRLPPAMGHVMVEGSENWIITRKFDITLTDGSEGIYYILLNVDFLNWYFARFSKLFFISFLVILVVINGILTYFVSRSIIKPLRALKKAAGEIKEGNLSYRVTPHSRDEIGELAAAFEEMRLKLKQSIELQIQYEENRKHLVTNISHDLKTPVTGIKGYVEGIIDGVADTPEKMDRYLRTIHHKTTQMDRLIDELFMFSKLDLKKLPFHFEEVDLNAFLQSCVDELQFDVEKSGVKLAFDSPAHPGPAYTIADREKLRRVFVNIIENAAKYMDKEDGYIRIALHDEDEWYKVVIQDNGQGIAPESLPYIFDRFYRADPSRNANAGGSGLGLAIAQHIIEEHGGAISAVSELGTGTAITISMKKRPDGGNSIETNIDY